MLEVICPLCLSRVSNWEIVGGKTTTLKKADLVLLTSEVIAHNSCLMDYKMSNGKEYGSQ